MKMPQDRVWCERKGWKFMNNAKDKLKEKLEYLERQRELIKADEEH